MSLSEKLRSAQGDWRSVVRLRDEIAKQQASEWDALRSEPQESEQKDKLQTFAQWLTSGGVDLDTIETGWVKELGCNGVKCKKQLSSGQRAFSIPRKLMLDVESVHTGKVKELEVLAKTDPVVRMPMIALGLYLMLENAKGSQSAFFPYLQILPRSFPGLPMLWSAKDLEQLDGTEAGEICHKRLFDWMMAYAHFTHTLPQPLAKALGFSFTTFLWSLSITVTRQNPLPLASDPDRMGLALIPLFDMCNHEDGMFSTGFNPDQDLLECNAKRDFAQGEEFRIFYGERGNTELLVYSGFVLDPGCNLHHKVKGRLCLDHSDPFAKVKEMALQNAQAVNAGWYVLDRADPVTLQVARVIVATKEQIGDILRAQQVSAQTPKPVDSLDEEHEAKTKEFIVAAQQEALKWRKSKLETLDRDGANGLVRRLLEGDVAWLENKIQDK